MIAGRQPLAGDGCAREPARACACSTGRCSKGGAVGLLPDQAPGVGEGVWADFFGRPAYTMTLVVRLQRATGAAVIMVFAERLPGGRGYHLHLEEAAHGAVSTKPRSTARSKPRCGAARSSTCGATTATRCRRAPRLRRHQG